jgi:P4 family phage/plasmid primase-like protien
MTQELKKKAAPSEEPIPPTEPCLFVTDTNNEVQPGGCEADPSSKFDRVSNEEERNPQAAAASVNTLSAVQARLWYAEKYGWVSFPVPPGTKKSHKSQFQYGGRKWGATSDPAEIKQDHQRWSDANVGIPTGAINKFWVLEADTAAGHDVDGIASLRKLEEQNGALPPTRTVKSPSGSLHYYFKWRIGTDIRNSASRVAPGVDVRGEGGLVVAPPSKKAGVGQYVVVDDRDPAEPPDWLVAAALAAPTRAPPTAQRRSRGPRAVDWQLLTLAMKQIPNPDLDQESWCRVLMALWGGTQGDARAKDLAHGWSKKSESKYDKDNTDAKWAEITGCPATELTLGTIYHMASEANPEWRGAALTDLGNAKRLVGRYGEDLRHVGTWRCWLVWRDGHWRRDEDGAVMRMAKATVEKMFAGAAQIDDEDRRKALRSHAIKSQNAQRLVALVKLAESEIEVVLAAGEIDADPYLIGVKNGVIDLRRVEFREARRDDYVTKIAGAKYDVEAKCPNWDDFLKRVMPSEDVRRYLARVAGYTLTGLTSEEVIFLIYGKEGNNGKTTWRETIFAVMGDYAIAADANLMMTTQRSGGATPDVAKLHGCRLVTINETEDGAVLNEGRVKYITGTDRISARRLYEAPFDFTPSHKAVVTTNHKPIVRGIDEGIWRRINLIGFEQTISGNVNFRAEKLIPELSGILNWMLDGLREYYRIGLAPPKAAKWDH